MCTSVKSDKRWNVDLDMERDEIQKKIGTAGGGSRPIKCANRHLTPFPRRRMASVPKASAAALRLPMAVTRARGGPGALYITLAGSPELGATSARSK